MILESWSLFINQAEQKYQKNYKKTPYQQFILNEYNQFKKQLEIYLPQSKNMNSDDFEIVPTFMNIFDIVLNHYQSEILSSFPTKLTKCFHADGVERFCSYSIGFKPFSLINKSGAKIYSIDDKNKI